MFNPFKLEQDLQKLTVDANRARQTLEEQMIEFERKKMEDIKVNFDTRGNNFKSRLSLIVRVNVVLNRTVVIDSD